MAKMNWMTKSLAIAGTVLVWTPIAFMVGTSVMKLAQSGRFMMDYLIPAELFPVVAVGAGMLLWAALRAHARRRSVGWGIGIGLASLGGGVVYTTLTGLASGRTPATGPVFYGAVALIILYALMLPELGVSGILLIRDLFKPKGTTAAPV